MNRFDDSVYDLLQAIYDAKFRYEDKREEPEKEKYSRFEEKCYPCYEEKKPCHEKKWPPYEEEKWICKKEKFPCHEEKFPCHEKKHESCFEKSIFIENKINCCKEEKKHEEEGKKFKKGYEPVELVRDGAADGEALGALRGSRREEDAFAYLYLSAAIATVVPSGSDVPLNQFTVLDDVFFNPPAATVQQAGAYEIFYSVNLTAPVATPTFFAIAVNGVPQTGTFIPIPVGTIGEFSGNAILKLNRNDTVTIRNVPGGSAITLAAIPGVGAQLDLVLLERARRILES